LNDVDDPNPVSPRHCSVGLRPAHINSDPGGTITSGADSFGRSSVDVSEEFAVFQKRPLAELMKIIPSE
jgi:hypothetical protein